MRLCGGETPPFKEFILSGGWRSRGGEMRGEKTVSVDAECRKSGGGAGGGQDSGWRLKSFSQKVPSGARQKDTILPPRDKMDSYVSGRCHSI